MPHHFERVGSRRTGCSNSHRFSSPAIPRLGCSLPLCLVSLLTRKPKEGRHREGSPRTRQSMPNAIEEAPSRLESRRRHLLDQLHHLNRLLEKPASPVVAKQQVAERNKAIAAAVRAEKDQLTGRDFAKSAAITRRASPEEVAEISRMLNVAQRSVVPPWKTPSWFNLFRYVDSDGSGLICYEEFEQMVREVLKLSRSSMPEERLRALWLALDTDSSGQLSAGEVV